MTTAGSVVKYRTSKAMTRRIFMQSSSAQRFLILRKEPRCFTSLFVEYADVPEHGRWMHLLRIQLRKSVRRLAVARFYFPLVTVYVSKTSAPDPIKLFTQPKSFKGITGSSYSLNVAVQGTGINGVRKCPIFIA